MGLYLCYFYFVEVRFVGCVFFLFFSLYFVRFGVFLLPHSYVYGICGVGHVGFFGFGNCVDVFVCYSCLVG